MYVEHYGFTEMPFQLTPNSRFFFGSKGHSRAIAHLIYGLSQEEGFVVITGEVGAGKTTLVERIWAELDRETYTVARVVTTQVSGDDLLRLVVSAFGLRENVPDKASLLTLLEAFLLQQREHGRRPLLVVDEVQNLSFAALEELRMLSNITHNGRSLLQTLLLGQPQFRRTLADPDLDQLRQRILASYHLGPLSAEETGGYIEYRLKAVGWSGNPSWTPAAYAAVHHQSGGIPRRINRLCARVLFEGALEDRTEIDADMVDTAAVELHHDLGDRSGPAPAVDGGELAQRVQTLEVTVARRERVFQRLTEVLDVASAEQRR